MKSDSFHRFQPSKRMPVILFIIYFILAHILFIFANITFIKFATQIPPGNIYLGAHYEWTEDYYTYLAYITQGKHGDWLISNAYTSEDTPKAITHILFIIVGKIAALFNFSPQFAYLLARIATFEMYISSIYLLCSVVLGFPTGLFASVLCLIGTISSHLVSSNSANVWLYPYWIPWWYFLDPLERLNDLPHHLFGEACLLLSVSFLFLYFRRRQKKLVIFSTLSFLVGSIVLPSIMIPGVISLMGGLLIKNVRSNIVNKRFEFTRQHLTAIFLICLSCVIIFTLFKMQKTEGTAFSRGLQYELDRWNHWETTINSTFPYVFGIFPFFIFFAVIHAIRKGKFELLYLFLWNAVPIIILPFVDILGVPKVRLLQTAYFIPMGILTTYVIFHLFPSGKRLLPRLIFIAIILLSNLPLSYYLYTSKLQSIEHYQLLPDTERYTIPKTSYTSYLFIEKTIPKNSVILSSQLTGLIIPAFAPVKSVIGYFLSTINYDQKDILVKSFYKNDLSLQDATRFLIDNHVSYIYYGPYEKLISDHPPSYPHLLKIYGQNDIMIFQVTGIN